MPFVKRPDGTVGFEKRMKKRKKGVFVAVAGNEQEFQTVLATVKGFFNWANIELTETLLYTHEDDELGGVGKEKERISQAFDVGVRLARQKADSGQPEADI